MQTDASPSSSRGLFDILPSIGYSSILPGVLRTSLLRSGSATSRPTSGDARSLSRNVSSTGSSALTSDSEVSAAPGAPGVEQDASDEAASTSGREDGDVGLHGEPTAAAAERHRLSSASTAIDLQV